MDHEVVEVRLEGLEVRPRPSAEELVLDVAEHLLRRAVVDAVALPGHALHHAGLLQPPAPTGLLVLPAHVRVQDRPGALGLPGHELVEQLVLLGHVGVQRRGPGDDLLAAEVVDRREVGLAPGLFELGDVGAHLFPRPVGGEVAPDDVLEGLSDLAPVRVVPVVVGLAADPAADAHLAHHLQHGLVGYAHAPLGAQAHGDLPVAAPVGRAREYLGGGLPELGPGGSLRVRQRVVVARPRQAGALQQAPQPVPLFAQGAHGLDLRPGQSPSLSTRARNFFR